MDSYSGTKSHRRTIKRARRVFHGWVRLVYLVIAAIVLAFVSIVLTTNHAYITTPSMYPTIPPGSMAFIQREPAYHVGEVIEFRANGLLWIHRFVGIRPDGSYITKGDNPQSTPDVFVPEVRASDVVGRVTMSIPYLGFPELFVHDPRYALQWLQAELGIRGRLALMAVAAGVGILLITKRRKVAEPTPITLGDESDQTDRAQQSDQGDKTDQSDDSDLTGQGEQSDESAVLAEPVGS